MLTLALYFYLGTPLCMIHSLKTLYLSYTGSLCSLSLARLGVLTGGLFKTNSCVKSLPSALGRGYVMIDKLIAQCPRDLALTTIATSPLRPWLRLMPI